MAAVTMRKVPPSVHDLTASDHLPSVRRLRVQVVTNSKGYVELNLNHRGLGLVPPETFQLVNTQVLRLDHNHIDYLPSMIAYLRGLRVLDLQRNVLVHLPETLVNCKHLAELRLNGNRLASLPRSVGGLKNLRILELGANQLEELPEQVGLLHSLRTLDLHSNRLWHLPFSLQELRHLLNFNLSDNMFDHVPLVVTKMTSIRALNLSKNRLAALPLDMDALKGLRELNLSHNKMASVTSVLVTLTHLKYLSLAHNGLKFLPSRISQLQNLRVLHLQGNELRHVPSCLRRLRYYNVSSNLIKAFSVEGMRALVSLTASKNRLHTVPRGVYKLKHLKFLCLDGNALVEIGEEVGGLRQLKVLNLSHNNLHALPSSLHRLPQLQSFNVKGNLALTKRKSRKTQHGANKMPHTGKDKTEAEAGMGKQLLKTRGVIDFKHDDRDSDGDDDSDDNNDDDDEENDEGIGMGLVDKDTVRPWTASMHDVTRAFHGNNELPNLLSSKSLDDLTYGASKGKSGKKSLAGKQQHSRHAAAKVSHTSTERPVPKPSKLFVGWDVALPAKNKHTTLKKMTSSNFANQSATRKTPRGGVKKTQRDHIRTEKKNKPTGVNKKSKKSLKEIIFGTKSKNKPGENLDGRGVVAGMKSSASVHLPLKYAADELDARSRGYDDGEDVNGYSYAMMTRYPSDNDVRDWKSVSHGYGSWRSRTKMLWKIEAGGDGYHDLSNMADTIGNPRNDKTQSNPSAVTQNKQKKRNNRKKSSFSTSDTLASDFTYQKFGGKSDCAPASHQSSNASRRYPADYDYHVTSGNERYSVGSGVQGWAPRPSSRSKWLGQWFGPGYESSFTLASDNNDDDDDDDDYDENNETPNESSLGRSHEYSVREARASFATETTMDTQRARARRFTPAQYTPGNSLSDRPNGGNVMKMNSEHLNLYRPLNQPPYSGSSPQSSPSPYPYANSDHHNDKNHHHHHHNDNNHHHHHHVHTTSSTNNLPTTTQTASHEFPPFSFKRRYHPSHYNPRMFRHTHSDHSHASHVVAPPRSHFPADTFEHDDDATMDRGATSSQTSHTDEGRNIGQHNSSRLDDNLFDDEDDDDKNKNNSSNNKRTPKYYQDFDHILETHQQPERDNPTSTTSTNGNPHKDGIKHLDDNFALKKKSPRIPRSKSMTSLDEGLLPPFGATLTPLPKNYGTMSRGAGKVKASKGGQLTRTDYTLLGVCNQIETLLDKNLLQPVIGFKASHRFEDKTIQERKEGVWHMDLPGDIDLDQSDVTNGFHGDQDQDVDPDVLDLMLDYNQPQSFNVTSTGGQFMTCDRPDVKVTVPAHSVSKSLHVTIQTLTIGTALLSRARRLNHFIDNITAMGPVVYFYHSQECKLNSPASFTLPAPPSVKGSHLAVLTIRRDNSCMPCSSAFRSGHSEVTVTSWHFTAKVTVLTKAKCKYKACKAVEILLQCIGANTV